MLAFQKNMMNTISSSTYYLHIDLCIPLLEDEQKVWYHSKPGVYDPFIFNVDRLNKKVDVSISQRATSLCYNATALAFPLLIFFPTICGTIVTGVYDLKSKKWVYTTLYLFKLNTLEKDHPPQESDETRFNVSID